MSKKKIFQEFNTVSAKEWKQKIQTELKGADYNDTLIWQSPEGIDVKPFYHPDETSVPFKVATQNTSFAILQNIFVQNEEKSNKKIADSLQRGAESIRFILEKECNLNTLFKEITTKKDTVFYFKLLFFSKEFINQLNTFSKKNNLSFVVLLDPIEAFAKNGNWFNNTTEILAEVAESQSKIQLPLLSTSLSLYQNAGANIVQQLAYTLAHTNEYFNVLSTNNQPITFEVAVGTNYFFEIAKIKALRLLFNTLAKEYNHNHNCTIIAFPTKRNKTLYDYNVNMLRSTTECMSAILGGANAVANLPYDAIYHKDNEFGDRIARNQLLILKNESYFNKVNNPTDGAYYIETITEQLAEKALALFKEIERSGGLLSQLFKGTIQRKITESANKEVTRFTNGEEVLLGTNKYPNDKDKMKDNLELYPFLKQNPRKTLITPILEKRLAEKAEQERLKKETVKN